MTKKVFTVTVDINDSLQTQFSGKVTPQFIERTLNSAMAKINRAGPERSQFTIQVTGGGPLTQAEQYRVWLREMVGRLSDPR